MAIELWRQLGLKEIHLVAHDYGTTIANEIIVRKQMGYEPVKIKSLTLSNGSMHIIFLQISAIIAAIKSDTKIAETSVLWKICSKTNA